MNNLTEAQQAIHMNNYIWLKWILFARVSISYSYVVRISHTVRSVVLCWMTNNVLSLPSYIQQLSTDTLWVSSFPVHSTCVGTEGSLNAVEVTLELSDSQLHHWAEVYTVLLQCMWNLMYTYCGCGCILIVIIVTLTITQVD